MSVSVYAVKQFQALFLCSAIQLHEASAKLESNRLDHAWISAAEIVSSRLLHVSRSSLGIAIDPVLGEDKYSHRGGFQNEDLKDQHSHRHQRQSCHHTSGIEVNAAPNQGSLTGLLMQQGILQGMAGPSCGVDRDNTGHIACDASGCFTAVSACSWVGSLAEWTCHAHIEAFALALGVRSMAAP